MFPIELEHTHFISMRDDTTVKETTAENGRLVTTREKGEHRERGGERERERLAVHHRGLHILA